MCVGCRGDRRRRFTRIREPQRVLRLCVPPLTRRGAGPPAARGREPRHDVVPDGTRLPLVGARAGVYRALADEFGTPDGSSTTHPDARIIALGAIRPIETSRRPVDRCVPVGFSYLLPSTSTTRLRAQIRRRPRSTASVRPRLGLNRCDPRRNDFAHRSSGAASEQAVDLASSRSVPRRDSPTSAIVRPDDKAELTGSTQLVAVTRNVYAHVFEFHLSGSGRSDTPISNAVPVYGVDSPMGLDVGTKLANTR